jgi:YbbR domain-containing protein
MIKRLLRRIFKKNWGLKLFSVLLAIALWLALIPTEKVVVEKAMALPLEMSNIPPNMELVEKPISSVDVTLRGPSRIISQVTTSNLSVILNLAGASVYQQEYPLYPSMIDLPNGAEVVRIYPNRVHLRLEETKSVMMGVEADFIKDSLRPGYRLVSDEVVPSQVLVRGPQSKVNPHDKVRTVPIDLAPYTQPTEFEADLILPRPELRLAANHPWVRVKLDIVPVKPPEAKPARRH